jgi:hypothetical protein
VERPTCIFTVRFIAIYSVDQGHSTNFGAFGPTLSADSGGFRTPIPIESGHPFRGFRTPEGARRLTFV